MTAVQQLVNRARRRLRMVEVIDVAALALPVAGWAVLAWIVATRLGLARMLSERWMTPLIPVALGCAVFGAYGALLLMRRGWPSTATAAALLDERLNLASRMSTAIALRGRDEAFALAAVRDAERAANDPALAREFARCVPLRLDARWRLGGVTLALVAAAWLLLPALRAGAAAGDPRWAQDSVSAEKALEAERRLVASIEAAQQVAALDESIQKAIADAQQALERANQKIDLPAEREAQAFQQRALLEAAMEKAAQSESLESVESLKDALAQLPLSDGDEREMMEALKRGDFEAAKLAAEKLAARAQSPDAAVAASAKQALERVAAALSKAGAPDGASASKLASALAKAGLDPKLASNPAALAQALKTSNLPPSTCKNIQKLSQKSSQNCKQCNSLGNAAKQAAAGRPSTFFDLLKKCSSCSSQGQSLSQALASCRGGGAKPGGGSQQPVLGDVRETDPKHYTAQEAASASQNLDAEPIARDFVQGDGASREQAVRTLTAIEHRVEAGLEEGSDEDPVPAALREAHQRYFSQWKKKIDAAKAAPKPPSAPGTP
jgi:hypothetical protein